MRGADAEVHSGRGWEGAAFVRRVFGARGRRAAQHPSGEGSLVRPSAIAEPRAGGARRVSILLPRPSLAPDVERTGRCADPRPPIAARAGEAEAASAR